MGDAMSQFQSRERISGRVPGERAVLWSNNQNAALVFENYKLRSQQWYLKLLEPSLRSRPEIDPIPESGQILPEFGSLEDYQQAVDAWVTEPNNWFHRLNIYDDGRFNLIVEHWDDEHVVCSSIPLRVKLTDGRVASFKPHVDIKTTYWFGTNYSASDGYLTEAIKRLEIPPGIVALCDSIASTIKVFEEKRRVVAQ